MDTCTLAESYLKEGAEQLLIDEYVIVSSRIRKTVELDNIVNASNILFSMRRFLEFKDTKKFEKDNLKSYMEFLQKPQQLMLLISIIKTDIIKDGNLILLCSPNELKHQKILKYLGKSIELMFDYPVFQYKKNDSLNELSEKFEKKFNLDKSLERVVDWEQKIENYNLKDNDRREKYLGKCSKKDLRRLAKRFDIDVEDMDKDEMIEEINYFIETYDAG